MNNSILTKLEQLSMRLEEVGALLSDPDVAADQNKFRELSIEHAQLTPINEQFENIFPLKRTLNQLKKCCLRMMKKSKPWPKRRLPKARKN